MDHIYDQPQFGEDWFTYSRFYLDMVQKFPTGSKFVEIGSWKGKSSAYMAVEIANSAKQIEFTCVDTFLGSTELQDCAGISELYNIFISNMKPLDSYYNVLKMTSLEASSLFEDKSLDFVFIDGCHEYECVKTDIISWMPKVKSGGIFAGHDYRPLNYKGETSGVFVAVNELLSPKFYVNYGDCWIVNID